MVCPIDKSIRCDDLCPGPFTMLAVSSAGTALIVTPAQEYRVVSAFTGKMTALFPVGSPLSALLRQVRSFKPTDFLFSDSWLVFKVPNQGVFCYAFPATAPWRGAPEQIFGDDTEIELFWARNAYGKAFAAVLPSGRICAVVFGYAPDSKSAWLNAVPLRLSGAPLWLNEQFFVSWRETIDALNAELLLNEALAFGDTFDGAACLSKLSRCTHANLAEVRKAAISEHGNWRALVCGNVLISVGHTSLARKATYVAVETLESKHEVICSRSFDVALVPSTICVSQFGRLDARIIVGTGMCGAAKRCVMFEVDIQMKSIRCWMTPLKEVPKHLFLNWRGDIQSDLFYMSSNT